MNVIDDHLVTSVFDSMPILYLEYIENKARVRADCMNKTYVPNDASSSTTTTTTTTAPPLASMSATKYPGGGGNISYLTEETEVDEKERNDLMFRYQVLKRIHPNADIPVFSPYADPKVMAKKYEVIAKKLTLDSNVESWKMYMIVFMMGCEVVLGKLNFDMEGFGQQQIMAMENYDALLLELAEKNYVPVESKWPVEVRLLGTVVLNVVIFIIAKTIEKKTKINVYDTIRSLVSSHKHTTLVQQMSTGTTGTHVGSESGITTSSSSTMKSPTTNT